MFVPPLLRKRKNKYNAEEEENAVNLEAIFKLGIN